MKIVGIRSRRIPNQMSRNKAETNLVRWIPHIEINSLSKDNGFPMVNMFEMELLINILNLRSTIYNLRREVIPSEDSDNEYLNLTN